jgi:hypothetical protein
MFKQTSNFVKPGLFAGIIMLLVMLIVMNGLVIIFPQIEQEYSTHVYRNCDDILFLLLFLHPFLLGLIISWTWNLTSIIMKGDELTKVVNFTFAYIMIAQIPGLFLMYSFMNVSLLMIMSWLMNGLLQVLCGSFVISKMTRKKVSIF